MLIMELVLSNSINLNFEINKINKLKLIIKWILLQYD